MRSNEQEGVDYHFSGIYEFNCRQKQNDFAAVTKYNDWYYGVPKSEITNNSVLVTTPCCIKQLKRYAENICVFYIKVPRRDRLIKSLMRNDDIEEIYRRSLTDLGQFDGIEQECDYVISNQLDSNKFNYIFTIQDLAKNINELYKSNKKWI